MWQWPILRKVCWKTSRFSLYRSDLLPAHLPGRWQGDRGVLVWKVGAVQLPGGQRISRACYHQRAHKEGTLRINIGGTSWKPHVSTSLVNLLWQHFYICLPPQGFAL